MDYLYSPSCFTILSMLFGLIIGSFLNVVIYRLPKRLDQQWHHDAKTYLGLNDPNLSPTLASTGNLLFPASYCPSCLTPIKPWHNIPIISYLWLKGRCRSCQKPIGLIYPGIELLTGVTFAIQAWYFGPGWLFWGSLVFTAYLIALSGIDAHTQLLPDQLTLSLLWLGLLFNLYTHTIPLSHAVLGAAFGYGSLWLIYHGFKWITGKEGMGYGDFKLLAALGAWLGYSLLPLIILIASFSGALIGIVMLRIKKAPSTRPISFGPYLAIAGWIALMVGDPIMRWYLT